MITLTFSVTPDHTAIGVRNAAQREMSLTSGRDHLAPSTVACRGREFHPSADPSCSQTTGRCRQMSLASPCCPAGTDFARTRIAGRRRLPQVVAGCRRSRGRRHLQMHSMRRVHWKIQLASIKQFAPASHVLSSIVAPLTPAAQRLARDRNRFQDRFSAGRLGLPSARTAPQAVFGDSAKAGSPFGASIAWSAAESEFSARPGPSRKRGREQDTHGFPKCARRLTAYTDRTPGGSPRPG